MSPHRRRCTVKAILEIKGTLAGVTVEDLLKMTDAQLLGLFVEIEKALESANGTEPAPPKDHG